MSQHIFKMGITALTLVAITTSVMAPAAEAGRQRSRRYKGRTECGARGGHSNSGHGRARGRVIEIRRCGDTGAVLAGIIGGIALGAAIANASDRQTDRQPDCVYVDPYCGERFASLDAYHASFRHHRHPRVVRVIEVDSGRCVHTYRYSQGRWCDAEEWEEDYDDYEN